MATIVLTLDDTPAMREVLRTLGVHCVDDNAPYCEGEAEEAERRGESLVRRQRLELAAAYEGFNDEVTRALL